MKLLRYLIPLLLPLALLGQPVQKGTQTVTVSGTTVTFQNYNGALSVSFEYVYGGTLSTVSTVLKGCAVGGTCDTIETSTATSNAIHTANAGTNAPYSYFTITPTFTGGTSPTLTINYLGTVAAVPPGTGAVTATTLKVAGGTTMTGNQGNGALIQHSTGTLTSGNVLAADANGNVVDSLTPPGQGQIAACNSSNGSPVTGTGSPVTLYTCTIPAGVFPTNGRARCHAMVKHSAGTTASYVFNWLVGAGTSLGMGTVANTTGWQIEANVDVMSTGASAQYAVGAPLNGSGGAAPLAGTPVSATAVTQASSPYTITLQINAGATEQFIVQVGYCTVGF